MEVDKKRIILIDLPTFPKGVISLSLLSVAAGLREHYAVQLVDLNFPGADAQLPAPEPVAMYGLKVSSQNLPHAIALSQKLKTASPQTPVVWGGELPSLLPDLCLEHADVVFGGLFEPIADAFIHDLQNGGLQRKYFGKNTEGQVPANIDFSLLPQPENYFSFMGYPLETSRGCTENCIFCMVHTMQKKNYLVKGTDQLQGALAQYKGKFINVVDYNFGVDAENVKEVSRLIKNSGALGWMAEMCIELLDNEEVLQALGESRCKIVYCGLESIDQQSLESVNKMRTNHIENYERIIRKAQAHGIQIAAGIILGMEGTHPRTFDELYSFFHRMGIIYAKLTFLIYNPGTKVQQFVRKKGRFVTDDISHYDGNRLTYLPDGVDLEYVKRGTRSFIRRYYSLPGIVARSFNTRLSGWGRLEYILFNLFYRKTYRQWLTHDTLSHPENVRVLVDKKLSKSAWTKLMEKMIYWVRIQQMKRA